MNIQVYDETKVRNIVIKTGVAINRCVLLHWMIFCYILKNNKNNEVKFNFKLLELFKKNNDIKNNKKGFLMI